MEGVVPGSSLKQVLLFLEFNEASQRDRSDAAL
jgi:hypothetical protein